MSEKPEVDFPEGAPPADLTIEDITVGDGEEAAPGRTAVVHYVGVAFSTGEEFDASWNRGESVRLPARRGRGHRRLGPRRRRDEGRRPSPPGHPAGAGLRRPRRRCRHLPRGDPDLRGGPARPPLKSTVTPPTCIHRCVDDVTWSTRGGRAVGSAACRRRRPSGCSTWSSACSRPGSSSPRTRSGGRCRSTRSAPPTRPSTGCSSATRTSSGTWGCPSRPVPTTPGSRTRSATASTGRRTPDRRSASSPTSWRSSGSRRGSGSRPASPRPRPAPCSS